MRRLVVDVDVCTLDIGQRLELHLQLLRDVVGRLEGLVGVHDDVDLDEQARSGRVGADGVDCGDQGGVGHCCFVVSRSVYGALYNGDGEGMTHRYT